MTVLIQVAICLAGCTSALIETTSTPVPVSEVAATATPQPPHAPKLTGYEFPTSIDPANRYLFYLHGKIIEDQGLPAMSPDYGEYEYEAILKKLESRGFVVISELRPKNTDAAAYAGKIVDQVNRLLEADVPPENITVAGASKGAGIAAIVSHFLKNTKMNFILLGFCHSDTVEELKQNQLSLYGNVLAIRDSADELAGSCEALFAFSGGIRRHDEIILHIGTGHGILYKPLDEWILPAVQWAKQ